MFRPITYAPRGRMSHSFAILSASLARGSPMCQPCSSRPRLPRGSSRLWSGPATKPSNEIDMWQVVSGTANLLSDCDPQADVRTIVGGGKATVAAKCPPGASFRRHWLRLARGPLVPTAPTSGPDESGGLMGVEDSASVHVFGASRTRPPGPA